MASLNRMILIGNLGRDPVWRRLPGGEEVCILCVVTSEAERTPHGVGKWTEWHRVVLPGRIAAGSRDGLKKGAAVYVEGRLRRRSSGRDGARRDVCEILASSLQLLGGSRAVSVYAERCALADPCAAHDAWLADYDRAWLRERERAGRTRSPPKNCASAWPAVRPALP